MRILPKVIVLLGLGWLCSCATHRSLSNTHPAPQLPPEQILDEKAGPEDLLIVTLRLSDGQTVPCVVDTGCGFTMLDQSLKYPPGPPLQTKQITFPFRAEGAQVPVVYAAPKLYLGNVPLMTGPTILVGQLFDTNNDFPYKAILGIDCLRHYCIQMDFDEHKLRFLDSTTLKREALGLVFPLNITTNYPTPLVDIQWATNRNVHLMVDTGFRCPDFSLPSDVAGPAFQNHEVVDSLAGTHIGNSIVEIFLFPNVKIGRETYKNVSFVKGDIEGGLIDGFMGLPFLARHKVTFDFPSKRMYLKSRHPETGM